MSTNDLRPLPPQERLHEVLDYDQETGIATHRWRSDRAKRWNSRWAGKRAGRLGPNHSYVHIDGESYLLHRVIYKWLNGIDPPGYIDHHDCDPANNQPHNIRPANKAQNSYNRPIQRNNTSGHRGVCWDRSRGKWTVGIKINGRKKHLGRFSEYETACQVYQAAARRQFGEFYHEGPTGAH